MSQEIFLIDSNSLITPHMQFYPFDLVPGFWAQIEAHLKAGNIKILDMVRDELLRGNDVDDLKTWMEGLDIEVIDRREPLIVKKYSEIVEYLNVSTFYKPTALTEWSKDTVADPWLIATAAVYNYTLITFEKPSGGLNPATPNKFAKIPDVANVFGVETRQLYYLMRSLNFKFS